MKLPSIFFFFVIIIFMSSTDAIAMNRNFLKQRIQKQTQPLLDVFESVIKIFTICSEILKKNPTLANFKTILPVINSAYEMLCTKIQKEEDLLLDFMELKDRGEIKKSIEAIKFFFHSFYKVLLAGTPNDLLLDYRDQKNQEHQVLIRFLSNKFHCDLLAQGEMETVELFFREGLDEVESARNLDIENLNIRHIDQQIGKIKHSIINRIDITCDVEQYNFDEYTMSRYAHYFPECLMGEIGAPVATLDGHGDSVRGITHLHDGRIASCSDDNTIKIWNLSSNECLATLKGHDCWVRGIEQLHNGCLASCSDDKTIKIWDLETFKCIAQLAGHDGWVLCIIQLHDGCIATGSADKTIKIWDLGFNECVATLEGHTQMIRCIKQLYDGCLASCSDDGTMKIWNLPSNQCITTLEGHTESIRDIIQLHDGRLASCSLDKTIKIWDLSHNELIATLEGHNLFIHCVIQLNDGRIASCSDDRIIKIWDLKTLKCIATLEVDSRGKCQIIQLRDGRLVSCSDDRTIKIWDLYPELSLKQIALIVHLERCRRLADSPS